MKRWAVVIVLGAALWACGDWRGRPRPAAMAELSAEAPSGTAAAVPPVAVANVARTNGSLTLATSGAEGLRPADDTCVEAALRGLALHAKGETVLASGRLALGQCLAASLRSPNSEVLAADEELRFYFMISCDGVDLGSLDGKSYGDLLTGGAFPCDGAQGARIAIETEDLQAARFSRLTPTGLVVAQEGRRVLHAVVGADGGPCRYVLKEGHLVREACIDVNRVGITRSRLERGGQVIINPDEGKEDDQRTQDGPGSLGPELR